MTCEQLDDLIEPLAAGEIAETDEIRVHVASCARCRRALVLAAAVERTLAAQPPPRAPEAFALAVLARTRRERWRSERYVDLAFNAVVALAVVAGLVAMYVMLSVTGVAAVSADVVRLFLAGAGEAARQAAPHLRLYAAATLLVGSGVALWWWAEHGLEI